MDTHERLDFNPIGNGLEQNQASRGGDEGAPVLPQANLRFDGAGSALPIRRSAGYLELTVQNSVARGSIVFLFPDRRSRVRR